MGQSVAKPNSNTLRMKTSKKRKVNFLTENDISSDHELEINTNNSQIHMSNDKLVAKYADLKCDICGLENINFNSLKKHFQDEHSIKAGYVVCCQKRYYVMCRLLDHVRKHQNPEIYKCNGCDMVLNSSKNLKEHEIGHEFASYNEELRTCSICNEIFKSYTSIRQHMYKIHRGMQPFNCRSCGQAFTFKFRLEKHMSEECDKVGKSQTHFPEIQNLKNRTCSVCKKVFKRFEVLKAHMYRSHPNLRPYRCGSCGRSFSLRPLLQQHIKKLHKRKIIPKNKVRSDSRKIRQTQKISNELQSKKCMGSKENKSLFVEKLNTEEKKNSLHVECRAEEVKTTIEDFSEISDQSESDSIFENESDYWNAMPTGVKLNNMKNDSSTESNQNENELITKYIQMNCDICGTQKATFKSLKTHYLNEHGIQNGYVVCCKKRFTVRGKLLDHAKSHQNPNIFKCNICGKVLTTRKILCDHKDGHTFSTLDEESRTCCICNKVFEKYEVMKRHMYMNHSGIQPYDCKACGRKFTFKFRFQKHISEECVGVKENQLQLQDLRSLEDRTCVICKKVFKRVEVLRAHMHRSHKEFRPFKCSICESGFRLRRTLLRHFINHQLNERKEVEINISEEKGKLSGQQRSKVKTKRKTDSEIDRTCVICTLTFQDEEILESHLEENHKGIKHFKCSTCGLEFGLSQSLQQHLLESRRCSTDIENKTSIKDDDKFEEHYDEDMQSQSSPESNHNAYEKDTFETISKVESSKKSLKLKKTEQQTILKTDEYDEFLEILEQCQTDFASYTEVSNVSNVIDEGDDNVAEFSGNNISKTDLEKDGDKLISKYIQLKCEICGLRKDTFKNLKSHFQDEHDAHTFCVFCCNKRFTVRGKLLDHAKSHQNPDVFKCDICGKVLSTRKNLSDHKDGHEFASLDKEFRTCSICNEIFEKYDTMKAHMYKKHSGIQPYDCKACGRKFLLKYRFQRHIATECVGINENQLKPQDIKDLQYRTCVVCGKVFKHSDVLKTHMHRNHSDLKPFKCIKCGLEFRLRHSLEAHLKKFKHS